MSIKRGKFDFLTQERQQRTEESPEEAQPEPKLESAQDSMSTSAQAIKSTSTQTNVERRPSGQRIRTDLLRSFKIMAAEIGVPQYQLIEEALEEYLERKRTR